MIFLQPMMKLYKVVSLLRTIFCTVVSFLECLSESGERERELKVYRHVKDYEIFLYFCFMSWVIRASAVLAHLPLACHYNSQPALAANKL